MKIVFLAPFGIRPKGTLIARMLPLAKELTKQGHRLTIVAPPYTNPEDSGRIEDMDGVCLHNIELGPDVGIAAAPLLAWRMLRACMAEEPDLVHLFKPKGYGGLAAMLHLFAERLGIKLPPLFVDCDDWEGRGGMNERLPYSMAEKAFFQFQENWLPPRADGVTVASRTLQTKVWGMGVPQQRVFYIPNGVSLIPPGNREAVRELLGISQNAPVLLLYTRFFEFAQSKLHYLFAEIYRRVPGVRFLVVGKGPNDEESQLQQAAVTEGFHPSLVMAGWIEPSELPDYLAAGDVAIYPFNDNLVNRSKCPAKVTELLRAGIPVVADGVGQLAEYVRPGISGLLSAPDDWQEMLEHAVKLLLDRDYSRTLGKSGCDYMKSHYSWQIMGKRLEEFYSANANKS